MTADASDRARLWRAIVARARPVPDLELLARWRAGDLLAGEELGRRHEGSLHRFFATKCRGDAAELARRTLRASLDPEDPPRERSSVRALLFALARQELQRYLEQRRGEWLDLSTTSVAEILDGATDPGSRAGPRR
jgi:hypothetical protein